ncbi:MAG: hypothetical protein VB817_05840, partial [Pirellulaceae bacterium]
DSPSNQENDQQDRSDGYQETNKFFHDPVHLLKKGIKELLSLFGYDRQPRPAASTVVSATTGQPLWCFCYSHKSGARGDCKKDKKNIGKSAFHGRNPGYRRGNRTRFSSAR